MKTNNSKKTAFSRKDFLVGICIGTLLGVVVFFALNAITNASFSRSKTNLPDSTRPHSPYLLMRDTIEGGFSGGWMPHFVPSEDHWIDMHTHLRNFNSEDDLRRTLDEWFSRVSTYRLGKVVTITGQDNMFAVFNDFSQNDRRFAWIYRPPITTPSVEKVREAVRNGACAIKLHNASIMQARVPRDIYESDEWQAIFAFAEREEIPLLWHVTQRLGYSPYHGGGLNTYWSDGWEKGIDFNNEDLLQDVLKLMKRFPKLKVIGAHQLHVGLDRLDELFKNYENLYIDSSCGMYLRYADEFIEEDRLKIRDFFETWSERIVFGTDIFLSPGSTNDYSVETFQCHSRFILKLGLNDKALQDVAWRTAERLLRVSQ